MTEMPLRFSEAVGPEIHRQIRERAIFDFFKLDQQVGQVSTCFPRALIIRESTWQQVSRLAEALAQETMLAEQALLERPDLHGELGLSWWVRHALAQVRKRGQPCSGPRLIRFDFHWTQDGFQISEANTDVPGGQNETSCYPKLFAPHVPGCVPSPDVVEIHGRSFVHGLGVAPSIGLVHASAYADDRQVMMYFALRLRELGATAYLLSPDGLKWSNEGEASAITSAGPVRLSAMLRFFPAEWLPNLPWRSGWRWHFSGAKTPMSNPATALLTQSKRFPLVWDKLGIALAAWHSLLPESRDPRGLQWKKDEDSWLLKPAMGRVGHHVGIREACDANEWESIQQAAKHNPSAWIAQKRFESVPIEADGAKWHVCLGIYTLDGRVAGAYGRVSDRPRIDQFARDIAVFIERDTVPRLCRDTVWGSTRGDAEGAKQPGGPPSSISEGEPC